MNKQLIQQLKQEIDLLEIRKQDYKQRQEEFEKENNIIIQNIKDSNEIINSYKETIKTQALEEYKQNISCKKLYGGIGIRVGTDINYDEKLAFKWAEEHKLCLTLDKKEFDKIAKTQEIEFVTKEEKITVTFPSIITIGDE